MKISLIPVGKESIPMHQSLIETNLVLDGNHQNSLGIRSKNQGEEFSNWDVEMELSPSILENYWERKSSLRSWKRII